MCFTAEYLQRKHDLTPDPAKIGFIPDPVLIRAHPFISALQPFCHRGTSDTLSRLLWKPH